MSEVGSRDGPGAAGDRRLLLFVVTEDWYFVTHRLALAVAAREAGYEVAVATRPGRQAQPITAAGIRLIPMSISRGVGNPLREVLALVALYRRERPALVHHVALKPVAYGTLAALLSGVPAWVNAVAGLGGRFSKRSGARGWLRTGLRWMLARLLDRGRSVTIVQNPDDRAALLDSGVAPGRVRLIRGAGVDTTVFRPGTANASGPVVMLVSRMLWDKGVGEFVAAARRIRAAGSRARFVLVGGADVGNAGCIPEARLQAWHDEGVIEWWGHRDDIAAAYAHASVACLPSTYGEGIPKSLLEAAACGLPIVTTDGPGCREVVEHERNGLLIPAHDIEALVAALHSLVGNPEKCARFGQYSRAMAEREFSAPIVHAQTLAVYREVLA
jgi:glycosyltransferase involved in cell wall biosynthesis